MLIKELKNDDVIPRTNDSHILEKQETHKTIKNQQLILLLQCKVI